MQRPAGGNNGKVQKYNLYVKSNQADKWKKIVSDGTFADKQELQKVTFDEVEAQYVKFEVTQGFGNFATAAELAVYQKASDFSKLQEAMDEVKMVVEGVYSAKAAAKLGKKYDVALPIVNKVNEVLFEGKNPREAVDELMLRDSKTEHMTLKW